MKKIAELLMEYGMDFQYENFGSKGEKIVSFPCSLKVTKHEGRYHITYLQHDISMADNEIGIQTVLTLCEEILIKETT